MSADKRPRLENAPCSLLDDNENVTLFELIGNGCVIMSSAVAQLYVSGKNGERSWTCIHSGVVCFVKDNIAKSYFLRLYSLKEHQLLWEQELYVEFRYKTSRDYFHTFEIDEGHAGLNFASEYEAEAFRSVLEKKFTERLQRKRERRERRKEAAMGKGVLEDAPQTVLATGKDDKDQSNQKKQRPISKQDISYPTDFRVVNSVAWNKENGFQIDTIEPEMRVVFESVGIRPGDQVQPDTIDFIYKFVYTHGGVEAVREEISRLRPPVKMSQTAGISKSLLPVRKAPPPPPPTKGLPPQSTIQSFAEQPTQSNQNKAAVDRTKPRRSSDRPPSRPPPPPLPKKSLIQPNHVSTSTLCPSPCIPPPLPPSRIPPPPPRTRTEKDDDFKQCVVALPPQESSGPPPPQESSGPPPPQESSGPPPPQESSGPPPPQESSGPPPPALTCDGNSNKTQTRGPQSGVPPQAPPPPPPTSVAKVTCPQAPLPYTSTSQTTTPCDENSNKTQTRGPQPGALPRAPPPPPPKESSHEDVTGQAGTSNNILSPRDALLRDLQKGTANLIKAEKGTNQVHVNEQVRVPDESDGIIDSLITALDNMRKFIGTPVEELDRDDGMWSSDSE